MRSLGHRLLAHLQHSNGYFVGADSLIERAVSSPDSLKANTNVEIAQLQPVAQGSDKPNVRL